MSNGKKILIVTPSLRIGGGAERIAVQLGNSLRRKGYNVILLSFYPGGPTYDWDGEHICLGYKEGKNVLLDSFEILFTARKIRDICRERDIDVAISFLTRMNVQTLLSKSLFGNHVKMVVSERNNPQILDKKTKRLMRWLYPKADNVVALSKGVEHILKQDLSLNNTTCIHNIQNIDKFDRLSKKDVRKDHKVIFDDDFLFVTIGRLTEQKAQWSLLRCFKKVTLAHEDSKLIVLGSGVLNSKLNELTKKMGIEDKVFFLGNVDNVFPYLKQSDCFVFTSLWEGFGNVLTEALSQNLPVISTDCVAGPREIICPELEIDAEIDYPYYGKYGILTKPFKHHMFFKTIEEMPLSEEELMFAEIMIKIKEEPSLRENYSIGYKRANEFNVDRLIKEWESVIG